MERKRSRGVTIFAWLMIILNIIVLLSSFDFKTMFECFKSFPRLLIWGMVFYGIISSLLGIFSGFGLLRLKDLARQIGIVINSIDLLFGLPVFFFSLNDIMQYSYNSAVSTIAKSPTGLDINMVTNSIFYSIIFMSWVLFILSLSFIYFFTRPKIKEQFK